jgi:hypothetical protein
MLCLFGEKMFGKDKMNMIWSAVSSSYCLIMVCCVIALVGTFLIGTKVVGTAGTVAGTTVDVAGRSFDTL